MHLCTIPSSIHAKVTVRWKGEIIWKQRIFRHCVRISCKNPHIVNLLLKMRYSCIAVYVCCAHESERWICVEATKTREYVRLLICVVVLFANSVSQSVLWRCIFSSASITNRLKHFLDLISLKISSIELYERNG